MSLPSGRLVSSLRPIVCYRTENVYAEAIRAVYISHGATVQQAKHIAPTVTIHVSE